MADQTDFDGSDVEIAEQSFRLIDDVLGLLRDQLFDITTVLLSQGSNNAGRMALMADDGFNVGLNAGTTTGIMAGKAQNDRAGSFQWGS